MAQLLEFHGRLSRADKRPASPGRYDLRFDLRPGRESSTSLWHEVLRNVEVGTGGHFAVVLGTTSSLSGTLFKTRPRWLSVRLVRGAKVEEEWLQRVPISGGVVELEERIESLEASGLLEERDERIAKLPGRVSRLQRLVEDVVERLATFEDSASIQAMRSLFDELEQRLAQVDGDKGRIARLEDELEELVGPDGDVVDLTERMDRIEGNAPELIEALRRRESGAEPDDVEALQIALAALEQSLEGLRVTVEVVSGRVRDIDTRPVPDADSLAVVRRAGDVMTGGLTINRGGLEVLSGGVSCRGANVNTLEASNLVKAPKVIADAMELRGEFTVDNPHRALQVRLIEGRQGSARRDGPLHLNTRGGAEVVVGNAEEAKGIDVHGPIQGSAAVLSGRGLTLAFDASGSPAPGELVGLLPRSGRVARISGEADPCVLGVVSEEPGLCLGGKAGSGRVQVATHGVVSCLVEAHSGPIQPGDLLVSSDRAGMARAVGALEVAPGAIFAKALEELEAGEGSIQVLLR